MADSTHITACGYGGEAERSARRENGKTKEITRAAKPVRTGKARPASPSGQKTVARRPDMSHPVSRVEKPNIVIGSVPKTPVVRTRQNVFTRILAINEPNVRTIQPEKKSAFPISLTLCLLLCFGLFMYMILDYVRINECSVHLNEIRARIEEAGKLEQELSLEFEKRNDLSEIARLAEEELGMVKLDEIKKVHLNTQHEDRIELTEAAKEGPTEVSIFSDMMSAIRQIYTDLTEYSE